MGDKTGIEWTDATWNPIAGCSIVSKGCTNCYAMQVAHRLAGIEKTAKKYGGLTKVVNGNPVWTGKLTLDEKMLFQPLAWTRPRNIFVNSMSDLFHEKLPDEWIDKIFAVMALTPHHTYQILTKRPDRMREYMRETWQAAPRQVFEIAGRIVDWPAEMHGSDREDRVKEEAMDLLVEFEGGNNDRFWTAEGSCKALHAAWPLKNVMLGVSVEDQDTADSRIPKLLDTPAALRFISAEPLLGPVDLNRLYSEHRFENGGMEQRWDSAISGEIFHAWADGMVPTVKLDWVITGGESGADARPMHADWVRSLRDQCKASGVPFFFKQWGEWAPGECEIKFSNRTVRTAKYFNDKWMFSSISPKVSESLHRDDQPDLYNFGKRNVHNSIDGETWQQMPAQTAKEKT